MVRCILFFLCLALGSLKASLPQISPDGKRLAYLAPINGVQNLWVKTIGQNDDHPIRKGYSDFAWVHVWAYDNRHLLYIGEHRHLYCFDVMAEETIDLTPSDDVLGVDICAINKNFPDNILIVMAKETSRLFDVYNLNIATGTLELVEKDPGDTRVWIADNNLTIRAAERFNADGSISLLLRSTEKDAWKTVITWNSRDACKSYVFGFSCDGKKLYWKDSCKSVIGRLIEYDCISGKQTILVQDPVFEVVELIKDSNKNPLAIDILKERLEWVVLHDEFAATLQKMQAVDAGDLIMGNASIDDRYWVIGFMKDNQSATYSLRNIESTKYYLFDKKTNKADFLFVESIDWWYRWSDYSLTTCAIFEKSSSNEPVFEGLDLDLVLDDFSKI